MYSAREIALAAGVSAAQARAELGGQGEFVGHDQAVQIGRRLIEATRAPFTMFGRSGARWPAGLPLALASTLHLVLIAGAAILASFGLTASGTAAVAIDEAVKAPRLVFLALPGPGGGGGGGGRRQQPPPPRAQRAGRASLSAPVPLRQPPPVQAPAAPPEPAPLSAEALPVIVAPIVRAPADDRDRGGVLQQSRAEADSHGPGVGAGSGSGAGPGLGEGDGPGIGSGSGGGTGGGPFRPGSGIAPPRLLKEVKGDYTEQARRAGITGDVVLEIVVHRDGSIGGVRVLQGLGGGLNERAIEAVKQWRFAPATRQGAPVEVMVEVAMEFKLR